MKNKLQIVLASMLLFALFTQAQSIIYVKFTDLTGDGYEYGYLYQNDNMSRRFIKEINLTSYEAVPLSVDHDFVLVVEPTMKAIRKDINNPKNVYDILAFIPFIFIGGLVGAFLMLIINKFYKVIKGK